MQEENQVSKKVIAHERSAQEESVRSKLRVVPLQFGARLWKLQLEKGVSVCRIPFHFDKMPINCERSCRDIWKIVR